jgi:hypothetical protein
VELFLRVWLKHKEILILDDLLQAVEVEPETDCVLCVKCQVLPTRVVAELGDAGLARLRFPSVVTKPPDSRGVDGVNNDSVFRQFC